MTQTKRSGVKRNRHFFRTFPATILSLCVILGFALGNARTSRADDSAAEKRAAAQAQFARAETLRAAIEAKNERERSLQEYSQLITAYRRVYLITAHAIEVPEAIEAVGDIYRKMGEQFEPKYFDSAVAAYQFLVRDYPSSHHREEAMLAIAAIERNNLDQSDAAQKAYEDFLKEYPRSPRAGEARKALAEITAGDNKIQAVDAIPSAPRAPAQSAPVPAASTASATSDAAPGQSSEVGRVRVWNADTYTRIVIDLGGQAKYQAARIFNPDRIYFDIENAHLSRELIHQPIDVPSDGYLKTVRVAQNRSNIVRVVLEVSQVKDYSVFELSNPDRLIVDVYGPNTDKTKVAASSKAATSNSQTGGPEMASEAGAPKTAPAQTASSRPSAPAAPKAKSNGGNAAISNAGNAGNTREVAVIAEPEPVSGPGSAASPSVVSPTTTSMASPSTAPVASEKTVTSRAVKEAKTPPSTPSLSAKKAADAMGPSPVPELMHNGARSLTRTLGLKVGRIVIDAGHGGHDTGTIGPSGLMEKDLCLDLALRLGKLIQERLPGADIVYTRDDDTFIPLEQRTAIANDAKADLFLSIHANSSQDHRATGIETYYLNFNPSPDAMVVATRENAMSQSSVHDLEDMVTKIARNEKVEESRDLATDIQNSLTKQVDRFTPTERDRGVRKAPFVVLIGANMPSVLAEISFLSNPQDELWLKKPQDRQRIAEGLYRGIESYLHSTNSLTSNLTTSATEPPPAAVARSSNQR